MKINDTPKSEGASLIWNVPDSKMLGYNGVSINGNVVPLEFSRGLERELNEANRKLEMVRATLIKMAGHRLMQVANPARELINKMK